MRTFGFFLVFAFAAHFIPAGAQNQQKPLLKKNERKVYVSAENLYFGNEGIFWQANQNQWIPISGVDCDSDGIYLTGSRISSCRLICKNCRRVYTEPFPSECETCGNTDFNFEYEDVWDRA